MVERAAPASPRAGLAGLPDAVLQDVASRLPGVDKLGLALASRPLQAALMTPTLWLAADVSCASGVRRASDSLLVALSRRARGALRSVAVSGRVWAGGEHEPPVSADALLAVAVANAGSLLTVHALCPDDAADDCLLPFSFVAELLLSLPALTTLDADMRCAGAAAVAAAPRLVQGEAPFGALRLRRLAVAFAHPSDASLPALLAALADPAAQPALASLSLQGADLHGGTRLDGVVDAAVARRLRALALLGCRLGAAALAPALTRLLGEGRASLGSLTVAHPATGGGAAAPRRPSPAFCGALRASRLTRLALRGVGLFAPDASAGAAVAAAAAGHPTLRRLDLAHNPVGQADGWRAQRDAGAALGGLVAADGLESLDASHCGLGGSRPALGPLLDALPRCLRLRSLRLVCPFNGGAGLGARVLAAARANASLAHLKLVDDDGPGVVAAELAEAEAVVAFREPLPGGAGLFLI